MMLGTSTCAIEHVGKSRNGKPRYWCTTHGASATGRYGKKLESCEIAYRFVDQTDCFELDEDEFPGGIALWGAVSPIYDTTGLPPERGIHVHARKEINGKKVIDRSFSSVAMRYRKDLFDERKVVVTEQTAVNYYLSKAMGQEVAYLFCIHCGEIHLDANWFAVHPHRKHLCHACGHHFQNTERSVSNPIAFLRKLRGDTDSSRNLSRASEVLNLQQSEITGGIQIWASNPAFLWISEADEKEGLHVHVFDKGAEDPRVDDTFDAVSIDGVVIDETLARQLMIQQSLNFLQNKIVDLACPGCSLPHIEQGDHLVAAHSVHRCHGCGMDFTTPVRRRKTVANPLISVLGELRASAELSMNKE